MTRVYRDKIFLKHEGMNIYYAWKGSGIYRGWYSIAPNQEVEGGTACFSISDLPKKYKLGPSFGCSESLYEEKFTQSLAQEQEAHRDVLRQAINDGWFKTEGLSFFQLVRRWLFEAPRPTKDLLN